MKKQIEKYREIQHTPTPWKKESVEVCARSLTSHIAGEAWKWPEGEFEKQVQANAEFIVRAVNNYEMLLEELKIAVNFVGTDNPIKTRIEKAIAKAEGK